jgi:hypothetical protein
MSTPSTAAKTTSGKMALESRLPWPTMPLFVPHGARRGKAHHGSRLSQTMT